MSAAPADAASERFSQTEGLAATLRRMSGQLVEKKSAKALLKERAWLRDQVRQLEDRSNSHSWIQRNKSLVQQLAEADRGALALQTVSSLCTHISSGKLTLLVSCWTCLSSQLSPF